MDICTTKSEAASQKQLKLACSNHGMVGPLTFEFQSIKLEIINLHIKKGMTGDLEDSKANTLWTEVVVNLFCWNHTMKENVLSSYIFSANV